MRGIHKSLVLLGAASIALTLPGCAKYERHEAGEHAKVDTGSIAETIKAEEKRWSDSFQANPRSLDVVVAPYADDAFFIAPGLGPTKGSADIRKAYDAALKDPNFNISFAADKVDVAQSGELAVATGRFTESYTDSATKQAHSGNGSFLTVYKKQPDGSWKVVQDWAVADPAG